MNKATEEIIVEVSQEEYAADLARGLHDDEVLPPGRHLFRRGTFLTRHGIDPKQPNVTIEIDVMVKLDPDILAYFQDQAALPDAEPLQAQINKALRHYILGSGIDDDKHPFHEEKISSV